MRNVLFLIPVIIAIIVFALTSFAYNQDTEKLKETFYLDATFYPTQKEVRIKYIDYSNMTEAVTLEILGMEQSYQKKFFTSEFLETVSFDEEPKYGWKINPVTLVVDHEELGKIGIKTEIHEEGTPSSEVIFGHP